MRSEVQSWWEKFSFCNFQIEPMLLRRTISFSFALLPRYSSSSSAKASADLSSLVTASSSHNDQICRIKLNNPRQRNILSLAMINELIKALDENEQRARVIVLTAGDQTVFSSGHSLKELHELSKSKSCNSVFDRCTELMLKYDRWALPRRRDHSVLRLEFDNCPFQ